MTHKKSPGHDYPRQRAALFAKIINRKGYYKRARIIQEITRKNYEPERQDRCYAAIWRKHIRDTFGMCYNTYMKYVKAELPQEMAAPTHKQLDLFDELK